MDELLRDLVLVFLIAGAALDLFHRLRLPSAVGLLVAGVIIGPHGLGVLRDQAQVDRLAEMGILLLMFSIGLDFTPDRFRQLFRAAGMGLAQMLLCIGVTTAVGIAFVDRWAEAVFLGFMVSHTSSTLMLKLFIDRGELNTPQMQLGLGISITQDLSSVLMLLAIPMMAGQGGGGEGGGGEGVAGALAVFGLALLRLVGVLVVAFGLAKWVIPLWLRHVIHSRSREMFLIFLIIVCLGTAWATLAIGLSVALGAFLAGMAIAASPYSHQTLAEVVPFRDLLVSVFFISIGMLLDVRVMWELAGPAALVVLGVLVLKYFSDFLPVLIGGYPLRTATLVGVAMAQIGEFAFVLSHAGRAAELVSGEMFQFFVLVAIVTMLVNPFLVAGGATLYDWLSAIPWLDRFARRGPQEESMEPPAENHVVVAGYGLNGQTVVRAIQSLGLPYAALDLNPDSVRAAQARGEFVLFGDSTRVEVLRKLHVESARVCVVAISDPRATRQTVQVVRHENPGLHIIARTKYLAEIEVLRRLGADEVIAEEFETTLEILARVLHAFHLPRLRIEEIVQHFRGDSYEAFRGPSPGPQNRELLGAILPALQIESVAVPERSPGAGKSLRELDLRARTGATVLAVQRNGRMETVPPPDYTLGEKDMVILAGTPGQILSALRLLEPPEESPPEAT